MVYRLQNMIWLCWILCFLASSVHGQFGGSGFGGNGGGRSGSPGFGSGDRSSGDGVGFRGGGGGGPSGGNSRSSRFGQDSSSPNRFNNDRDNDRQDESQQGDQMAEDAAFSTAMSSIESTMSSTSIATPVMAEVEDDTTPTANIVMSTPTSSMEATFEMPSSVDSAFSGPMSTLPAPPGIPLILPSSAMPNVVVPTAAGPQQIPTSTLDRFTITTSMTMFVTPSPGVESSAASAEEASSETMEASPTSSMDVAPLSTSASNTMSASQQAGMGIGITFGILSIAGATGLYLWRRRRNRRIDRDSLAPRDHKFNLGGFFRLRSRSHMEPKTDPEWSIESASKVEILRGGSVRSIRTGSRSDSPASSFPFPGIEERPLRFQQAVLVDGNKAGDGEGLEVLRVGMRVPDQKPNLALTSNPPVSPSAFPTPPSSRGGDRKGGEKTSSWPLPD